MLLAPPLCLGVVAAALALWGDAFQTLPSPLIATSAVDHTTVRSPGLDISLGLLCEYYEHGIEHAPPRDPRGVMQARESFYIPPPDPQEFLRAQLGDSAADAALKRCLAEWEKNWLTGGRTGAATIARFQQAAERSSLDAISLLRAAKGFEFLDGDELAAGFIRAALAKAGSQYASIQAGDPRALPLLREFDQTKTLWRLKDYRTLESRFRLARRLNPPLSTASRRATYLLADALFYQDRFNEAADTILLVQAEHLRVGDLGMLEKSDVYEMNYEQGYLLFSAGRFESAIPFLKRVSGDGGHAEVAARALFMAFLRSGRIEEAEAALKDLVSRFKVSPSSLSILDEELETATQQQQWRRQALVSTN
jgi:hypothetical protein